MCWGVGTHVILVVVGERLARRFQGHLLKHNPSFFFKKKVGEFGFIAIQKRDKNPGFCVPKVTYRAMKQLKR